MSSPITGKSSIPPLPPSLEPLEKKALPKLSNKSQRNSHLPLHDPDVKCGISDILKMVNCKFSDSHLNGYFTTKLDSRNYKKIEEDFLTSGEDFLKRTRDEALNIFNKKFKGDPDGEDIVLNSPNLPSAKAPSPQKSDKVSTKPDDIESTADGNHEGFFNGVLAQHIFCSYLPDDKGKYSPECEQEVTAYFPLFKEPKETGGLKQFAPALQLTIPIVNRDPKIKVGELYGRFAARLMPLRPLTDQDCTNFYREIKYTKLLKPLDNVCKIFHSALYQKNAKAVGAKLKKDGDEKDEFTRVIYMELCDGDLVDLLPVAVKEKTPLKRIKWTSDLINVFAEIHRMGLVHGDVKPENVFSKNGITRLSDFGSTRYPHTCKDSTKCESGQHTRSVSISKKPVENLKKIAGNFLATDFKDFKKNYMADLQTSRKERASSVGKHHRRRTSSMGHSNPLFLEGLKECQGEPSHRGTLVYYSPERRKLFENNQTDNSSQADDIWALGCIVYRLVYEFLPPYIRLHAINDYLKEIKIKHNEPKEIEKLMDKSERDGLVEKSTKLLGEINKLKANHLAELADVSLNHADIFKPIDATDPSSNLYKFLESLNEFLNSVFKNDLPTWNAINKVQRAFDSLLKDFNAALNAKSSKEDRKDAIPETAPKGMSFFPRMIADMMKANPLERITAEELLHFYGPSLEELIKDPALIDFEKIKKAMQPASSKAGSVVKDPVLPMLRGLSTITETSNSNTSEKSHSNSNPDKGDHKDVEPRSDSLVEVDDATVSGADEEPDFN